MDGREVVSVVKLCEKWRKGTMIGMSLAGAGQEGRLHGHGCQRTDRKWCSEKEAVPKHYHFSLFPSSERLGSRAPCSLEFKWFGFRRTAQNRASHVPHD